MPGGVADTELLDLVSTTLQYFDKLEFGAPQKYTDLPILNRVLDNGWLLGGGKYAEYPVVIKPSGQAQFTQMYANKNYNQVDVVKKVQAPWARLTTHWLWDRRETLENRDAQQIVDLMTIRRIASTSDMANKFEEAAWQTVISESNEFGSFRGIPYWVAKGQSAGSYSGTSTVDRSGTTITTVGNIDGTATDNAYWANWYDTYTDHTSDFDTSTDVVTLNLLENMLKKMSKAYLMTNFKAPRHVQDLEGHNPLGNFKIYMNTATMIAYEAGVRRYNVGQNFGYDIGKFEGMTAFNRTPIERVPQLDTYASSTITGTNPIYFINHNMLKTMALRGDEWYEHDPIILPDSGGNVCAVNVDLSVQLLCKDRRSQALICAA
jgi:hypothetical protein